MNGFSRFYVDGGGRFWSREQLEGIFKSTDVTEPLDSPFVQSIIKELESRGYIKLLYDDQRYLEVFDIDRIQTDKKKTS